MLDACLYDCGDGSQTRLIADTEAELIEKLALSHQNAVSALVRTQTAVSKIKSQNWDERTKALENEREQARNAKVSFDFVRANPEFVPCQSNERVLTDWVKSQGLPFDLESLQLGFDLLRPNLVTKSSLANAAPIKLAPTPQETAPPADPVPSREEIAAASAEEFKYMLRRYGKQAVETAMNRKGE